MVSARHLPGFLDKGLIEAVKCINAWRGTGRNAVGVLALLFLPLTTLRKRSWVGPGLGKNALAILN